MTSLSSTIKNFIPFRKQLSGIKQYTIKKILHIPTKLYPIKTSIVGVIEQGGCNVPVGLLNNNSVCYCFGAGEMISFDIDLVEQFKSNVFIFDPTPRAVLHFDLLRKKALGEPYMVAEGAVGPWENIKGEHLSFLHYTAIGVWKEKTTVKFYVPTNPEHDSHSIVNLSGTNEYFEAPVNSIANIMKENGHKTIDFLKCDVEGAEYEVIKTIINDRPDIKAMNFEFDEVFFPQDKNFRKRINAAVKSLVDAGYYCYYYNDDQNIFEFIRKDVYADLLSSNSGK